MADPKEEKSKKDIEFGHVPAAVPAYGLPSDSEVSIHTLVKAWHKATSRGNPRRLRRLLEDEKMVNFREPNTGQTTLHRLAAGGARAAIRVLLTYDNLDLLARDGQGRLASEVAFVDGRDPALCHLLEIKEREQAQARNIKLAHRPE